MAVPAAAVAGMGMAWGALGLPPSGPGKPPPATSAPGLAVPAVGSG